MAHLASILPTPIGLLLVVDCIMQMSWTVRLLKHRFWAFRDIGSGEAVPPKATFALIPVASIPDSARHEYTHCKHQHPIIVFVAMLRVDPSSLMMKMI